MNIYYPNVLLYKAIMLCIKIVINNLLYNNDFYQKSYQNWSFKLANEFKFNIIQKHTDYLFSEN